MRTEEIEFEVVGRGGNRLWLRVLHGPDEGMRRSVPVRDVDHEPGVIATLDELTDGDCFSAVLESEGVDYPDWRVSDLDPIPSLDDKSRGALGN
ncbi:hypothetical protein RYH80_08360 [Halobaculum sp. MBLA0147]|uniref:hypothetical protein n=1 Tax=Halobaculum sp. MBLA0147 TaxID=3079934 RepID=UPI003526612E